MKHVATSCLVLTRTCEEEVNYRTCGCSIGITKCSLTCPRPRRDRNHFPIVAQRRNFDASCNRYREISKEARLFAIDSWAAVLMENATPHGARSWKSLLRIFPYPQTPKKKKETNTCVTGSDIRHNADSNWVVYSSSVANA